MRAFAQTAKASQQTPSAGADNQGRAVFAQEHPVIPHSHRTLGRQVASLSPTSEVREANPERATSTAVGHKFSQIPVHAVARHRILSSPRAPVAACRKYASFEEGRTKADTEHGTVFDKDRGVRQLIGRGETSTATPEASLLRQLRQAYFSGRIDRATALAQASLGVGRSLPATVKTQMNRHFRRDLSFVRVHTDQYSGRAAKALDANAFTTGSDIVFAPGMFRPDTSAGQLRIAHELAHAIQQTGFSVGRQDQLEQQASLAAGFGYPFSQTMSRVAHTIQREPTYPRRSTLDQMVTEARRVLSLTRDPSARDETMRMWSNVSSNFGAVTTGSIARRIWTHIFLRHFTEPQSRGDVESRHPRYLYSHQYGWIDAQHFFGFIDIAEAQSRRNPGNRQRAFEAATAEGRTIEERQQSIRDYVVLQREPARGPMRHMQVRPPNTALFRTPIAAASAVTFAAARAAARVMLRGTQRELYSQLNRRQRAKFFMDSAKSAFTFEDFVSNQLGTRFFFQHGDTINSAPVADRERLFLAALSSFFSGIRVENDQRRLDQLARSLPTIERFEAPKTTEARERERHPELFELPSSASMKKPK